ncbi:hypothetical protein WA588_001785 [Blastocystis sp. NMH]
MKNSLVELIQYIGSGLIEQSLQSPNLVSTAIQCLLQFWKNAASSIPRCRVKWLLEQLFAVMSLPEGILYSQRSSIHLPFRFPTECFPVLREKIPGVVESLRKFVSSGVLDESIPDCIVVIMKVYSQETYLLSQYKDLFALLLQLFLPDQEVLVAEFAS